MSFQNPPPAPHGGSLWERLSRAPLFLQFLCLKNIRMFLKVCHDKFGLRNSELFDPFDLFDVRDFGKVGGALGAGKREVAFFQFLKLPPREKCL